ncbi:MAG: hypothetical protein ACM31E_06335, partial [Fibrobacterota bacterium]
MHSTSMVVDAVLTRIVSRTAFRQVMTGLLVSFIVGSYTTLLLKSNYQQHPSSFVLIKPGVFSHL